VVVSLMSINSLVHSFGKMNDSVTWNLLDWFRVCAFVVNGRGLMIAAMANTNTAAKLIVILIGCALPFKVCCFVLKLWSRMRLQTARIVEHWRSKSPQPETHLFLNRFSIAV
jgi:hypothetical protein